jgi:hypothetical protein
MIKKGSFKGMKVGRMSEKLRGGLNVEQTVCCAKGKG